MKRDDAVSDKKIFFHLAFIFSFYGFFLFVPAGTVYWPEAWLFLISYFIWMLSFLKYLQANNPELLRARLSPSRTNRKKWDDKFIKGIAILFLVMLSVAGIDAVRVRWTQMPLHFKAIGFLGLISALALFIWVMKENRYLSKIYEIRKDMGHKVVTTGPYRYVRHPMYLANVWMYLCIPLLLGSLYSFIPAFLSIILFIIRSHMEDRALNEELDGYKEYAAKVKFKLIPMIW